MELIVPLPVGSEGSSVITTLAHTYFIDLLDKCDLVNAVIWPLYWVLMGFYHFFCHLLSILKQRERDGSASCTVFLLLLCGSFIKQAWESCWVLHKVLDHIE